MRNIIIQIDGRKIIDKMMEDCVNECPLNLNEAIGFDICLLSDESSYYGEIDDWDKAPKFPLNCPYYMEEDK